MALTRRFLTPAAAALEVLLLEIRAETDLALGQGAPSHYGKPYPLGYCWEITHDVMARLRRRMSRPASPAERSLAAFLRHGGRGRHIWGALRGRYFQNAFQFGDLYIDVANDTVDINKPKIEILGMSESGFSLIESAEDFAKIAASYWGVRLYANHALPTLAPVFPMVGICAKGGVRLYSNSHYMVRLFCDGGFAESELWLGQGPAPPPAAVEALRAQASDGLQLADLEPGRDAALAACQRLRAAGVARSATWRAARLADFDRLHAIPGRRRG